jgi:hypothetical protein
MIARQTCWRPETGWQPLPPGELDPAAQLVLVFGAREALEPPGEDGAGPLGELRGALPAATFFGCSTAGEIFGSEVCDGSLVATAVRFDDTRLALAVATLAGPAGSFHAGRELAAELEAPGLAHVLVLSEGLAVNGTELVAGLVSGLGPSVTVTGGLAADGTRFARTLVLAGDGRGADRLGPGRVAALGLYGERLRVGYGSLGGWDPFGPERRVTRSRGNVLYELDGQSALGLYKRYLGEHAAGLPATGLLFPLSVRGVDGQASVVRTILGVDEAEQSLTFAGDVPEGCYARLMKANFDRLVDGAIGAARRGITEGAASPELALLISCVGRKMVLQQRVEEEVEGVRQVVGPRPALAGFYSYGEISPFVSGARCELHNQTMTVTTFGEATA